MASNRELWPECFNDNEVPGYPCPRCDYGNLILLPDSLRVEASEWSITKRDELDGELNDFIDAHFIAQLKCAVSTCGQIVSVYGQTTLEPVSVVRRRTIYKRRLIPKGFFPPPSLATIPSGTPEPIAHQLRAAFGAFWLDLCACANCLRVSVERVLDHFDIKGQNLNARISKFEKSDKEHAKTFEALRYVGNAGSHGEAVSRNEILDCFEIYQDALAELFGKRKERIAGMKSKLIASRQKNTQ